MGDLISVKNQYDFYQETNLSQQLKREALIVDRIAVSYWESLCDQFRHDFPASVFADLGGLYENGIIYDPKTNFDKDRVLSAKTWTSPKNCLAVQQLTLDKIQS